MRYLLDTNVCSDFLRGRDQVTRVVRIHAAESAISVITVGELLTWAYRQASSPRWLENISDFVLAFPILSVTPDVAKSFGRLRASLLDQGRPLPSMDLLIGATAIEHDLTVVTRNPRDFAPISGLRLIDWSPD